MPADRWRVFLDTNVLIAGLLSPTGASGHILDLGEPEEIQIVVSQHVLVEADRVFTVKFSHRVHLYRDFIKNMSPALANNPTPSQVQEAETVIHDPDDAPILAAAKRAQVDYLVTLDTRHFHTPKVRAFLPIPILTPAEFLIAFRNFWERL